MRSTIQELWRRKAQALLADVLVVAVAYSLALQLRFDWSVPQEYGLGGGFGVLLVLAVSIHVLANLVAGVYDIVSRHIGLSQAMRIVATASGATFTLFFIDLLLPVEGRLTPLSVVVAGGAWAAIGTVAVRFWPRIKRERRWSLSDGATRVLVVGAGDGANMILREVTRNKALGIAVVGLVDDNPRLHGMRLNGYSILGSVTDIPTIVEDLRIQEIVIAIPSAEPEQLARIHRIVRETGIPTKTLPPMNQLVRGEANITDIRELKIEDFLGRAKVEIDLDLVSSYLRGKRVMITGAAGSIGSELTRQVSTFDPASLILVDKDESSLYHLHEQLRKRDIRNYFIHPTSVALPRKMDQIFERHQPHVVFHAAAYKHVPLMEINADEAVINNVKGTLTIAQMAGKHGVERMVNISTDKAVDPINVMGATKLLGEQIVRVMGSYFPTTRFASVRFGNVLGSRGSVIPVFQQQIEGGGPVTVTHPDMTRYFMTIEEAVRLVLQAAALPERPAHQDQEAPAAAAIPVSGAFVLDMGEPIKIIDLAHKMINLLGNGHKDEIEIRLTGLRPGEKLHEALFAEDEQPAPTAHPLVFLARANGTGRGIRDNGRAASEAAEGLLARVDELLHVAESEGDNAAVIAGLQACVPSYTPFRSEQEETENATVWNNVPGAWMSPSRVWLPRRAGATRTGSDRAPSSP